MTELYPIGTELITKRLSQAALYDELLNLAEMESFLGGTWVRGFYREATKWRVTIIEYNQKWLSPVPIGGDTVEVKIRSGDYRVKYFDFFVAADLKNNGHTLHRIVERTYPNNRCAPLIEWDEVILPEQKG